MVKMPEIIKKRIKNTVLLGDIDCFEDSIDNIILVLKNKKEEIENKYNDVQNICIEIDYTYDYYGDKSHHFGLIFTRLETDKEAKARIKKVSKLRESTKKKRVELKELREKNDRKEYARLKIKYENKNKSKNKNENENE